VAVTTRRTALDRPFAAADGRPPLDPGEPGRVLRADAVVSAVPVQALRPLLSPELLASAGLAPIAGLETVPAISVVLTLDRWVVPIPPAIPLVAGGTIRGFFDAAQLREPAGHGAGSSYELLVSRAGDRSHLSDAELVELVFRDLQRVWPATAGTKVVDATVDRIDAAMFASLPGAHALRPGAETQLANFFVAGDWTRHTLNGSMEGAAVSGRAAAGAVLRARGAPGVRIHPVREPMPQSALRWLRRSVARGAGR
jgi:uncharacterized protein with NAD-binding domain and iron-sulfur cluster